MDYETRPTVPLLNVWKTDNGDKKFRIHTMENTLYLFHSLGEEMREHAFANMDRWSKNHKRTQTCVVNVLQKDGLDAAYEAQKDYGIIFVLLNMANAVFPGGAYWAGCTAQEQDLMYRTDMAFTHRQPHVIMDTNNTIVYSQPMTALIDAQEGHVYLSQTPLVCAKASQETNYQLLDDEEIFPVLEMRSAAVNRNPKLCPFDDVRADQEMRKRIKAQFETLKHNKQRHVVLSAFGCGAFQNDPTKIAKIYKEIIQEYRHHLDVVIFAIFYAGRGENNFDIFNKVLGKLTKKFKEEENEQGEAPQTF